MPRSSLSAFWLACLAVLLKLLGAPLGYAGAAVASQPDTLLWGSFCSAGGMRMQPLALPASADKPPTQEPAGKSCPCCAGTAGAPALPASYRPPAPPELRAERPLDVEIPQPPPYRRWPRLNPRASPFA